MAREQLPEFDQRLGLVHGKARHHAITAPEERRQPAVGQRSIDNQHLVVRAGAAAHSGTATLVSSPGAGTTVTVEVPLPAPSLATVTGGADIDG